MAAEKKFDIIAILAVIAALLLTVLFMNGEALGMQRVVSEEEVSVFTEDDLDSDWYTGSGAEITLTGGATYITLTGDGAEINGSGAYFLDGDVIIYAAGSYVLEGTLEDGSVIVNETSKTKGRVRVLLNGVDIHSEDSAAVDIEEATHVYMTLAEGTDNVLSDGETYSDEAVNANIRGALFSRDDLTINGSGSLTITGSYRHGIVCNDDLRVTGGNIYITAKEDGIHVNESARFTGMELTISAGDDGITVSNDDNEGELLVESGTIRILSCTEGLESEKVTINGGSID
ncbi:MAG: carbohydrate-binding domain-containing protein, partial [Lachnospiraceae bacterium]|nr:carbohydrate-binding domain-containing protein [Lachnospiraceae bacterium]